MKQTARIISTYSADVMGVCSALFELGGMTIMHDASGCNSTYTTHDEPRWYDMDSMVYISGISEIEAILGDDEKLIGDIEDAAASLHPAFIAIAGTPIPTMVGFDFEAVAEVVEARTGIPTFGFPTTGMNTYIYGASMALAGIAGRLTDGSGPRAGERVCVNILGLTPLDFSINGTDASLVSWLEESGFEVVSKWAMGSSLDELRRSGDADVNLVVSAAGLGAAEVLKDRFGIPYVTGLPIGKTLPGMLADGLRQAADDPASVSGVQAKITGGTGSLGSTGTSAQAEIVLIGEGVANLAIARAIELDTGRAAKVLCATECPDGVLRGCDRMAPDEDDIIPELGGARVIIADPLYKPICPEEAKFVPLPSEAFSGRIFRDSIPDLIRDFDSLAAEIR